MPSKRYNIKKILTNTVWIILGMGTIVLSVAAMNKKNGHHCKAVEVTFKGVQHNFFIDKGDIINILGKMNFGTLKGKAITSFNLAGMETLLKKSEWIENAELYFDNNDVLRINIMEREPIARVFTSEGNSFYIDSSVTRLPLSEKFSARLPVFTNFTSSKHDLSKADSNLLREIKNLSLYILNDPFWMAQIEQIDITPERSFEMIPKIGNQLIVFGTADDYENKFQNLMIFYKSVQRKVGWNKYSKINVNYNNEVIAVKRDADEIKMDSLKTIQLMKLLVANAQKEADSLNSIQLVQPRDDNRIPVAQPIDDKDLTEAASDFIDTSSVKILTRSKSLPLKSLPAGDVFNNTLKSQPLSTKSNSNEKPILVPEKKPVTKPFIKKPVGVQQKQPKAVMPPKNDY